MKVVFLPRSRRPLEVREIPMSLSRAVLDSGACPRLVRVVSLLALCLSLSACKDRLELVVAQESVTFDIENEGYEQPPLLIIGSVPNLDHPIYVGVTYTTNGVERAVYGTSGVNIYVEVHLKNSRALPVGTYQDVITFYACEDENCEHHLSGSPKEVPVTYGVREPLTFDPPTLWTPVTLGSSIAPSLPITLGGADIDWVVASSPSWLHLDSASGSTPSTVTATPDPLALTPGFTEGEITFIARATKTKRSIRVAVSATLPELSAPSVLTFGGRTGHDFSPQPLTFSLDTGTNAYPWTATVTTDNGRDWLSLATRSGSVSAAPSTVTASVNTAGIQEGVYKARITLTATVAGHTLRREVPVTLNVSAHKVLVPDNGVALVSTPSVSKLTSTVTVQDSFGLTTTPWTASSDSAWLSVTPSGKTGGPLTLTADPSGLAPDTLYTATVTLASSDTSVTNQERLRVGLWVGTSAAEVERPWYSSSRYYDTYVQADPIRPYVYLTDDSARIDVYNLYTGAHVTTLSIAGAWLRDMAVSHDGSTLYVADVRNGQTHLVDLETLSVGPAFTGAHFWFTYARTGGVGILLDSQGQALNALTGVRYEAQLESPQQTATGPAASRDGSAVCLDNRCYTLLYAGTLSISPRGVFRTQYLYLDSALNRDGSRIYRANGGNYSDVPPFSVFDGQTLEMVQTFDSPPATPFWVESGQEDQMVYAAHAPDGVTNVWLYDGAGSPLGSLNLTNPGSPYSRLALSGDGKRLVAVSAASSVMRLVTLP